MTETGLKETPLSGVHERSGADFTSFAGWRMPLRYSGHLAEHRAVRTAAGLFDLSHMAEFSVSGAQAAEFLDYALVVHASAMPVGRARYTMLCGPDGGVLDDLVVYRTADTQFLVIANAASVAVVAAELAARAGTFAVSVRDVSEQYALISLQGPAAAAVLAPLVPGDVAALGYYRLIATEVAGASVLLARTGYTGEAGYEMFVAPDDAVGLWDLLETAGSAAGVVPAGLAARDTLRLEAGMALYGNELTAELTPLHAGLDFVVPKDKTADYVGRAALEMWSTRPTPTVLVGLAGTGRRAARAGYPVNDPADGTEIGRITSGVLAPTLQHPIAMAYLPRAYAAAGTEVTADVRGTPTPMTVVPLPFYSRTRRAVRQVQET